MRPIALVVTPLLLLAGAAVGQTIEALPPPSDAQGRNLSALVGREVRSPDQDRVLGEIADVVIANDGSARAVILLEQQDRRVAVDLAQLRPEGGKVYLDQNDEELAALPEAGGSEGSGETAGDLPYGGLAPGWGYPQGGR